VRREDQTKKEEERVQKANEFKKGENQTEGIMV